LDLTFSLTRETLDSLAPDELRNLSLKSISEKPGRKTSLPGKVPPFGCFALAPGADSRSILADVGFSSKEVAELIDDKVVFDPDRM
jgi:hypothetical protein